MHSSFPEIGPLLDRIDQALTASESRDEALLAVTKLLQQEVRHYNWVGFYLVDDSRENLILGPYVGAPTDHVKIAFGKGICGQVAVSESSRIIQDVSQEDNYLSCSIDVRSEVVFPIKKDGRFVGELDIDSHLIAPFGDQDTELLEAICLKLSVLF